MRKGLKLGSNEDLAKAAVNQPSTLQGMIEAIELFYFRQRDRGLCPCTRQKLPVDGSDA